MTQHIMKQREKKVPVAQNVLLNDQLNKHSLWLAESKILSVLYTVEFTTTSPLPYFFVKPLK